MAAEGPLAEEVQALAGKVDRAVKASSAGTPTRQYLIA
jgi:hypothetical protein